MGIIAKIKSIWKLNGIIKEINMNELKTSSGRLQLLAQIVNIYAAVQGYIPATLAAKIGVAALTAYTIGRAIVDAAEAIAKLTPTTKDDEVVAEAKAALDVVAPKSDSK